MDTYRQYKKKFVNLKDIVEANVDNLKDLFRVSSMIMRDHNIRDGGTLGDPYKQVRKKCVQEPVKVKDEIATILIYYSDYLRIEKN